MGGLFPVSVEGKVYCTDPSVVFHCQQCTLMAARLEIDRIFIQTYAEWS